MSPHPSPAKAQFESKAIDARTSVVIRWGVSRLALGNQAPSGTSPLVHLELKLCQSSPLSARLIDPKSEFQCPIDLPEPSQAIVITQTPAAININSPLLRAHLQTTTHGPDELVYVHTELFKLLNIAGGRYEPIGCAIETHRDSAH